MQRTTQLIQSLPHPTTVLALMFALISGVTAYQGVSLLRDNNFIAVIFAIAVQGSVFATESLLVANLSTSKPEKSVVFLFTVFLGFLFIGSSLNAMLFFHIQGAAVAARNSRAASSDIWSKSRESLETFRLTLQQSLQSRNAENQAAVATENQKIMAERLAGKIADVSGRERLRVEKKELDRLAAIAATMSSLPLTTPETKPEAETQLAHAYRAASDAFAALPESARKNLRAPHPLPTQEQATDFLDLFMTESGKRTSTACLAWALGMVTECLPFIILLVGMPGIPWALRIRNRRQKAAAIARELFRAHPSPEKLGTLPFRIEQLSLSGTLELVEESNAFTADELEPSLRALEDSIEKTNGHRVQVIGLRNHSGTVVRSGVALRPQLGGQPLQLEVVTVGSGSQ